MAKDAGADEEIEGDQAFVTESFQRRVQPLDDGWLNRASRDSARPLRAHASADEHSDSTRLLR
jgi:hypothetical protein